MPPALPQIFLPEIPAACRPCAFDKRLYIEPFPRPRGRGAAALPAKTVSSSLFIFPERASANDDYGDRVRAYISGLVRSLECVSAFPGWEYVLYLDYSVYRAYESPAIRKIAEWTQGEIGTLLERHPTFHAIGVRFASALGEASTFLPSIWRFLPMTDPAVKIFTSVDADNPPNPLVMQLGSRWQEQGQSDRMFVAMESYYPAQCIVYLSYHSRLRPDSEPVYCPIAQFWFWRPNEKTKKGEGAARFAEIMDMLTDPKLEAFFEIPQTWILNAFSAVVQKTSGFRRLFETCCEENPMVLVSQLEKIVSEALGDVVEQPKQEERYRKWARAVEQSPHLLSILTLTVFGELLFSVSKNDAYKFSATSWSGMTRFEEMRKVSTMAGYGVDEYVLNHLMNPTKEAKMLPADVITPMDEDAGVRKLETRNILRQAGVPTSLRVLVASLKCNLNSAMTTLNWPAEYIIFTAMLEMFLRPDGSSSREAHAWFADLQRNYRKRAAFLTDMKDPVQHVLDKSAGFVAFNMNKMAASFLDVRKFTVWCQARDIKYVPGKRFVYGTRSRENLGSLQEIIVKRLFFKWSTLSVGTCIAPERIREFCEIPWF